MGHLVIPRCNANHFKMHLTLLLSKTTHKSKCTKNTDYSLALEAEI